MTVTIRRATVADALVLARLNGPIQALHAAARPDRFKSPGVTPELVAHYAARLGLPDTTVFIGEVDGEPAGYAVAQVVERPENPMTYTVRFLLLDEISVNPDQRRRGVGTALTAAVVGLARELRINTVRLSVYAFNEDALAFYARQGFHSTTYHLEIDLSDAEDIDAMG